MGVKGFRRGLEGDNVLFRLILRLVVYIQYPSGAEFGV